MVLDPAKEAGEEELPLVDGFGDDLEHVGRDEDFEWLERLWQVDVEVGRGRRRRARSGRHCCDESMARAEAGDRVLVRVEGRGGGGEREEGRRPADDVGVSGGQSSRQCPPLLILRLDQFM